MASLKEIRKSEESFIRKLEESKEGLKNNGVACFVINTNVKKENIVTTNIVML